MPALTRTPAVLVHGWAGSAASWDPVLKALDPAAWDAVALPLPGSPGGSEQAATVAQAADELLSLLTQMPSPAILVGHSMGAQITLLAHASAPELVHSEIVVDPAYAGDASSRVEMAEWATRIEQSGLSSVADFFSSATDRMDPENARRVRRDLEATDPWVIASYLRSEYVNADAIGLAPATARIAQSRRRPVLSVHSTQDSVEREASLPAPPGSVSELWEGHGHYLHLEDPARFVKLLDAWRSRGTRAHPAASNLERSGV